VGEVESLTGRGLRAQAGEHLVLIGSLRLMEDSGVAVSPAERAQAARLEAEGQTIMLVAQGSRLVGLIALADSIRPRAATALARLRQIGVARTIMLSGDSPPVAEAIARQAGITEVRAGLLPAAKAAAIQALCQQYGSVAMVGDGVNDAPALAHATVGIAMGGAGTDVALETADVALMSDDLDQLPFAVGLGRATRRVIVQNLVVSLGVIGLLCVASLTGWAAIGLAIVFHEGSTLVVVLNALRLLAYRPSA
jgi:Cd2+/Zn2+-exporting ATPase